MVQKKHKSITMLLKRYTIIMTALISIAVMSILALLFITIKRDYTDNMLINILGRQRMLTQIMAKDVGLIYELNSAGEGNDEIFVDRQAIKEKKKVAVEGLKRSKDEYNRVYESISKGYVEAEGEIIGFSYAMNDLESVLTNNGALWMDFKKSIEIVLAENDNTQHFINSMIFINENNEKLLEYSNEITNTIIGLTKKRSIGAIYLSVFFTGAALTFFVMLFLKVYRQLFLPLKQLYKGMAEVGIGEFNIPESEVKKAELMPVFSEVETVFDKLNSLVSLIENLNRNIPFRDILGYIYDTFSSYIPYTYIGVALVEDDNKFIRASYGTGGKHHKNLAKRLLGYRILIDETSLGKVMESGTERVINDLEEYTAGKPLKEYNRVLLEEGIRSSITFPLKNNGLPAGIIFFSSRSKNIYRKEHIEFLRTLANSIVLSLEKNIFIDDMVVGSIQALAGLAEQRDPETGEHLQRIKTYSRVIAEFLCKNKKFKNIIDIDYISDIEKFSPLHDIGKVGIRDDILLKPGRLTREEFDIMKIHTMYGAWVLKAAEETVRKRGRNIFQMGIEIAESHHEKWDGSGYPYGKAGEEIPLSARIVAVADVFDALTSKRPYKEPYSFEKSYELIIEGSCRHFDPDIIKSFVDNKDKIREVYEEFKSKGMLS